jgi:hypothetical protein
MLMIQNRIRSIPLGARGWRFPLWIFMRPRDSHRGVLH